MTADEIAGAFTAFTQGEHALQPHRFGGLGLGLAICKKLVQLHDGKIEARSDGRDAGTTIVMTFPLTRSQPPPVNPQSSGAPVPHPARLPKVRILVVEDHEPTRTALAALLARRRHRVSVALSMHDALALARKKRFDLVISDIGLPDGNGFELFKKIRRKSPVKGIALTGYGTEADIARSREAGFAAHLTKPVHIESLDSALSAVLND